MNKMIPGIIAIVIIAIGTVILLSRQTPTSDTTDFQPTPTYSGTQQTTDPIIDASGSYIPYSPGVLADASVNKRVLFFFANWCPTCKPADAAFETGMTEFPGITIIRVNYNDPETDQEEKDLAKQYNVTYQHTYVQIDDTGTEVTRWTGGGIEELVANVK